MRCQLVLAFILVVSATVCRDVKAQPSAAPKTGATTRTETAVTHARAKADAAKKLFDRKKWAEAFAAFYEADSLVHAPTFVLYMARCKRSLGKLTEAAALYKRVITETLAPSAPDAFVTAQVDAARELELVKQKIATLHVVVDGAAGRDVGLTIDGVPAASANEPIEVDPGKHDVVVTWGSGQTITRSVELSEGERENVRVELPAPPKPVVTPPPPPPPPAGPNVVKLPETLMNPKNVEKPQNVRSKVPPIVLIGTGVAGLAVGAISGGYALKLQADVKAHCDGTNCVRGYDAIAGTAETLAVVSNVGFVVGGLASAGGLIWLVSTMRHQTEGPPKGAYVLPVVGPGGMFLTGAF